MLIYKFQYLGIEVCISSYKAVIKAAIIIMSCDLPARALVLNMRQFNGLHACHLCEDEGTTSDRNRLFRWWPYQSTSVLRTKESLINNGLHATTHHGEIVSQCMLITLLFVIFLVQRCEGSYYCSTSPPI